MESRGIEIRDRNDSGVISVRFSDILDEISNGDCFDWAILYLWATGDLGEGRSMPLFEEEINKSDKGLLIDWKGVRAISNKFWQVIDLVVIGCKNKEFLCRYESDQEMHGTCDIVIEMVDSSYWRVSSKDAGLIDRLVKKFKEVKFIMKNT